MHIMWYDNIGIGSDALDYQFSRTVMSSVVQSSRYSIPFGFELHRMLGRSNHVPRLRISMWLRRGRDRKNATSLGVYSPPCWNNQTSEETWYNKKLGVYGKWTEIRHYLSVICGGAD